MTDEFDLDFEEIDAEVEGDFELDIEDVEQSDEGEEVEDAAEGADEGGEDSS